MRRLLVALVVFGTGLLAQAQEVKLIVTGNTHSRIYLLNDDTKICLPCNRATVINQLKANGLLLEYGYISPGSYGDLLRDAHMFSLRKRDYWAGLRKMGYDWVCDVDGQCQDKVVEVNGVRVGLVKVDKNRLFEADKYNQALSSLGRVDVLVWAVDDDVSPADLQGMVAKHSEVDVVLVAKRYFLTSGGRFEMREGLLFLLPYPDGIKVAVIDMTKEGEDWKVSGVKEVSVLDAEPDPKLAEVIKADCYANADCKTGRCSSGKCESQEGEERISLVVVRPKRCVSCNESEIFGWLKEFLPSLEMKVVYSDSEEAEEIFTKVKTDMLPIYILQGDLEKVDGFENLEDMLVKSDVGYVIRPQVVGMSVFKDRSRIPHRVDVFISGILSEPVYQELVKIREVKSELRNWRFYFHYLISYKNGVWGSLLGPQDMNEVLRQLCFRKYYPDRFLDYVLCRYELGYPQDDSCEIRLSADWEKVKGCVANPNEIAYLLVSSSKLTNEIGANTPGLVLFENEQIFVPSADVITAESFKKWSEGKE